MLIRTMSWRTALAVALISIPALAHESLWLEAEEFHGVRGYCWPMGRPDMKATDGRWGLSGPGWAAEWVQGGESGFLSIATGADDDKAVVTQQVEIPVAGAYRLWVRYGDWREAAEPFDVRIEQNDKQALATTFGQLPGVGEDNEMKLYWGWAFVWDVRDVELDKGPATITLAAASKAAVPRQVDVVVLTTDADYRPRIKERPADPTWQLLDSYRGGPPESLEPLARRRPDAYEVDPRWQIETLRDQGFLYLWNVDPKVALETWLSDDPNTVRVPWNIRDEDAAAEFKAKYAGQSDVPIFSDPRIVPTFHCSGPGIFMVDPATGEVNEAGRRLAAWLDAAPSREFAALLNYHPDLPLGDKGVEMFLRYRDRYVGAIAGESLGYFTVPPEAMQQATAGATTRRQLVEAFSPLTVAANDAKYRTVFGRDWPDAFADVISCMSVGNITFAPLLADWGSRTLGYESAVATNSILSMRWAFIRGIARQRDRMTATYRSCNFGDSATMYSIAQSYTSPRNIFDNYYSVYSGAGMTWYKFDIWYQYMAGSSMFYHEQGFDEWWKPGGTTAAGVKEVQLSPKGKLVDRFLRVTKDHTWDRGTPYTPVAILVDYAHGWEPSAYWPNAFKNWHGHSDRFLRSDHERMLLNYFYTAYAPIGRKSEEPITALNEVYLPGVFGDVFDAIAAYPDPRKWATIDTYPVVIVAGEIELTEAEGERLAKYVNEGGTLFVADAHLTGPGVAKLNLPATGAPAEATAFHWFDGVEHASATFRYKPITLGDGDRALATAGDGAVFCAASDRGAGRLIYLTVPHGMTVSKQTHPTVPLLFAHLTRGVMPVEVRGDVEWLVNRAKDAWLVTLLNPAGQDKPQQGISPTDYRENRTVMIRSRVPIQSATDVLLPTDKLTVADNAVELIVPAGDVRIIQLK